MVDTTSQLKAQRDLTDAIVRNLGSINQALSNQLRIQQLVNQQAQGGATDAAAVARATEDQLRSAGVSQTSYTTAATSGAADVTVAIERQGVATTEAGAAVLATAKKLGKTYDDTLKLISVKAKGPLRDAYSELQEYFGGLMGPGGIAQDQKTMANKMVGTFRDINLNVRKEMYDTSERFKVMGLPLGMAFKDLGVVMENFNEVALRQGVINGFAMMKDATADMAIEMKLFGKALGYGAEETSTFVQRQISLTGKAGTDMLSEAASMAKAMEKETGISAKVIGYSIERIIQDTENFGNVTVEEAARMSAALTQLGVGYDNLAGMVGKFQAFDAAVSSVSALTTVFGIQIDAMEMMKLANEDQETFLWRMRDSFLQAGRSADTMTLAQKRLVKEQLGLTDIEAVERLLDPTRAISSMEELTAATAKAPEEVSEVLKTLGGDILDLQDATSVGMDQVRTFVEQGLRQPLVQANIQLEQTTALVGGMFAGAAASGGAEAVSQLAKGLTDITGIDPDIIKKTETGLAGVATQVGKVMTPLTSGDWTAAMEAMSEGLGKLDFGGSMVSGVTDAVKSIEKAFKDMAANIIQSLKDAKIIPNSPNDILTETLNNVGFTAERTGEGWEKSLAKVGISTKDLTKELKDQTSVYNKLGRELAFQGYQYKDLDDDQKKMIRDRLQLGDISDDLLEKQWKMIMKGKGATVGRLRKTRETFATELLEIYKGSGRDISSFSDDFITSIEEQHGISRDTLAAALEEGADIKEIVTEAGKAKYEKEDKTTKGTSASARRAERKNREEALEISRSHTAQLRKTNRLLTLNNDILTTAALDIKGTLEKLQGTVDSAKQTVELHIDGHYVTDAVLRNPAGFLENGTVTIT